MYKNFLRIVISGRALNVIFRHLPNVIFRHLLNVILGFIPRIHTRQNSNRHPRAWLLARPEDLDSRNKSENDGKRGVDIFTPEYDNRKRMCFNPENDNLVAQCGRSMIEMLGVLAIIGVLSVGGIAGYSKAMEKFKINKTIQHITEIAANVQTLYMPQKDFNGLSSASSMFIPDDLDKGVSTQGFTIMEQWRTPEFFSIRYFGLSKEACFALATADWGADSSSGVYAIVVGDVSAIDYIPEDNPTEGSDFDKNYGNSQDSSYYATKKYLPISPAKITSYCTDEGAGNYNANSFGILFKK